MLWAKDKMLVEFHKVEHSKKEVRSKGHFPKWKEENAKKKFLLKNENKNFYTHCEISGHWNDKCWKLHPELRSK